MSLAKKLAKTRIGKYGNRPGWRNFRVSLDLRLLNDGTIAKEQTGNYIDDAYHRLMQKYALTDGQKKLPISGVIDIEDFTELFNMKPILNA
jgi:hypothetical protein